jgi:hypothetical protein
MINESHSATINKTPTAGFFPVSFPRDPVDVNIYLEHILLGQVLEPLVETGVDGMIIPAAAEKWEVSKDQRKIKFYLREGLVFSNGKPVDSEDVKYSIQRHLSSAHSQSKEYLSLITDFKIISRSELELTLSKPYVGIFKALSRDQLGILPKGWSFNRNTNEPFIGSGPYRAIKENGEWFMVENQNYRSKNNVEIKKWKILQGGIVDAKEMPDLVPFVFKGVIEKVKFKNSSLLSELTQEPVVHFFQSSAWWYPHGQNNVDRIKRERGMAAVNHLFALRTKALGLKRATGIIPEGITGHLEEREEHFRENYSDSELEKLVIAAFSSEFALLNDQLAIEETERAFRVKIKLIEAKPTELPVLRRMGPDILVFAFAGGFHDPEGFLTVITSNLGARLKDVFGSVYSEYLSASDEVDWSKRDSKYKKLCKGLIRNNIMVPGWKDEAVRVLSKQLVIDKNNFRYTPKLMDYRFRKEAI